MRRALPLLLAIAAFIASALIWIGSSRAGIHAFDRGSSANTSPGGLSLAYAYVGRQPGQTVKRLTTPLRSGSIPKNAVVIRVEGDNSRHDNSGPEEDDPKEKHVPVPRSFLPPAEDEFVRGGGRLILAIDNPGGELDVRNDAGKAATKVFPIWPGLDTVSLPKPRGLAARSLPGGMHTLFAANGEAIVAQQEIGAGDVIVVSVPELFENANIAADNHLALLAALALDNRRPVYFDEMTHGLSADDGALALLTEWRLGPLLALAGIAALLTLWRNARRVGLAEDEDRDTRSDAIDLVASLGALYERSMSSEESIALYHEALARSVAAQSGLRGDALHRRVMELTDGMTLPKGGQSAKGALPAHVFHRYLTIINDAFRTLERSARGGHDANHR